MYVHVSLSWLLVPRYDMHSHIYMHTYIHTCIRTVHAPIKSILALLPPSLPTVRYDITLGTLWGVMKAESCDQVDIYVCMYVCMCISMCVSVFVCVYLCMCAL